MKTPILLLALGSLLSTAHAQQAPAKPQAARAHAVVVANGKAIGRKFVTKSKPLGSRTLRVPIQ